MRVARLLHGACVVLVRGSAPSHSPSPARTPGDTSAPRVRVVHRARLARSFWESCMVTVIRTSRAARASCGTGRRLGDDPVPPPRVVQATAAPHPGGAAQPDPEDIDANGP